MARRSPRYIIAVVALLLGAVGAVWFGFVSLTSSDRQGSQGAAKDTFRVATYNINLGNDELALVVEAILESQADIVALQEVSPRAEVFLRERLASEYRYMVFEGSTNVHLAARFGFLSKRRIVRSRYVEPEHGIFGAQIAELEIGGRTVQLANVHLHPLDPTLRRNPVDLIRAALKAQETHRAEIERLYASLEPDIPAIILGDFNSLSFFKAPASLRDKGFEDSFAAVHTEADAHPTWQWPTRGETIHARIDYIFHDAALRTLESRVILDSSSDHFLLVSRLAFADQLD